MMRRIVFLKSPPARSLTPQASLIQFMAARKPMSDTPVSP